ncbi:glycine zipper domain-containing protein [Chromobacterium subtsugae]|uniref:glycine zipper domain-containing protein n=1 Tax=Chromobacterium subtsugae TaxID=251747 RepID=UPI000640D4FA|nr:glycine zipper domain-containing protein [Chromobacterium subtsugae]
MKLASLTLALALSGLAAAAQADTSTIVGGALGGAAGAAVGEAVGGRNGAIIGGAVGGGAGAAIGHDYGRKADAPKRDYRKHRHHHARSKGRSCPPGQAKKGRC